jgi:hypothetical protein
MRVGTDKQNQRAETNVCQEELLSSKMESSTYFYEKGLIIIISISNNHMEFKFIYLFIISLK